jgi:transposase-like protein
MKRNREDWRKVVARWEASGKSAAVFGRQVGAHPMTLYRWRRELRDGAKEVGPTLGKIVEVRPWRPLGDDRFELRLVDGRSLGVPSGFDAGALERLLQVLEAAR